MRDDTRTFYELTIQRAVEGVVANLDDALDLGELAQDAALSPLHFHRIFRGLVGETPVELHRRLRLERAALRLSSTEDPVTRIAFEAGYETHESFTRAFRDAFAASPTEFRARVNAARVARSRVPMVELAARCGIHFAPLPAPVPRITIQQEKIAMNVEVAVMPELRVAAVSHRGPYNTIADACGRLGEIAAPAGLLEHPVAVMVVIHHDDPETTPAADLRAEAGIVVPTDVPLPGELLELRIPAGRYARTTHVGPYNLLGDTWARFMGGWLAQSGHRVGAGATYECYRNTPMTAAPAELRTDLYVSLAD